jgi:hypothetical protein
LKIDTLCTCRFNFQFFFFSQRPKHLIITSQLQAPRANFSTEYAIHALAKAWLFWVVCSSTTESVSCKQKSERKEREATIEPFRWAKEGAPSSVAAVAINFLPRKKTHLLEGDS